ncbi:MAG: histidine phosphatase family protein [Anaerolineales bacterium]|nr:histidine phosphatase family protein [Anaerolineales bacterium]
MNLADHDRPLNARGKADAPRIGRLLRRLDLTPDLIITSSAERALATAESVALHSGHERALTVTRQLYHAEPPAYLAAVRQHARDEACVMVVGHNPGIAELVESLSGHYEPMPTAALAQFRLDIPGWHALTEEAPATLLDVWRPRELGDS